MALRRFFALLAIVLAGFVALAIPASAAGSYPPAQPVLSVNHAVVTPGAAVTVSASNFPPSTTVTVTLNGVTVGTVTTSSSGTATFTVNPTRVGSNTVVFTGGGQSASVTVVVQQQVSPAQSTSRLPATGANNTGGTLWIGSTVLVLGFALIGVATMRRRSHA